MIKSEKLEAVHTHTHTHTVQFNRKLTDLRVLSFINNVFNER